MEHQVNKEFELAQWMHERYEKHAKQQGWSTQKSTKVPFIDLPIKNKMTMILLARDIRAKNHQREKELLDEVLKLIKNEQSRFLKKRKELRNQGKYDEYKMGVLVGRLAELEGLKLLLEEKLKELEEVK